MTEDDKTLVERLRAGCPTYVENMSNGRPGTISGDTVAAAKLLAEAADRITQLSAEVERLTGVMEKRDTLHNRKDTT